MRRITARERPKQSGRARGNSHLSSGAERRKGEGRRQSRGNPERNNVARIKDGDGRTDGNADVYPRTVGRGGTAAEPAGGRQRRRATSCGRGG